LKTVNHVVLSVADTIGAFKTGVDGVKLQLPASSNVYAATSEA
jgi:hypothetical protein